MKIPVLTDVQSAAQRIDQHIHITPIHTNKTLNLKTKAEVYLKCENFQKTGAFKVRGATNTILSLSKDSLQKGVITHSSGNHGAAVACSATSLSVKSTIVIPRTAPPQKIAAVMQYGAEVVKCEPTLSSRESTTEEIIAKTGATLIHPYNDYNIVAGQGTAALEFFGQVPDLDIIMAPVGGGGLMSGTSIVAKSLNPNIIAIGTEPKNADDAYRSLKTGKRVTKHVPNTIADGLQTVLGPITFATLQKYLDEIITVEENDIIDAMRFIWERMKIIIEPSSAVPVAALFTNSERFRNRKIGIIISGGNVDLEHLPWNI